MIQKQEQSKSLTMIVQVVSNIYDKFDASFEFDPHLYLPSGMYNFLYEVNDTFKNRKKSLSQESSLIIAALLNFAYDTLLLFYMKFFDKLEEIEKKMPLQDSSRVIDCNMLLLLRIRKQLIPRIYSRGNTSEFSVVMARFTNLPHVRRWFSNKELTSNQKIMADMSDAARQRIMESVVGIPSEFMEKYVNGDPSALLQMYYVLFEEEFYQLVMKNVAKNSMLAH